MTPIQTKSVMVASSLAVLLALSACDRGQDRTAASKTDPSVSTRIDRAGSEARQETRDATAAAGAAGERAAESTKAMGASAANKVDDATITSKVNAALAKDKDLSAIKIDVDTKDGVVTLSGPAPTATARERASEIARTVQGVSSVNNQLTIKAG